MTRSSDPEGAVNPPLGGERVLDLTSGIAGAYCGRLLADAGASVLKVEPPGGDPFRWRRLGRGDREGDGPLFTHLTSSFRSTLLDPEDPVGLEELLDWATIVLWSSPGPYESLQGLKPSQMLDRHPHLVVTAISPFGLDTPWSDRPATDLTLQAWSGGLIGLGRGDPDLPPVQVGGEVGAWLTGVCAAIGTLCARARAHRDGAGELVDLSSLEVHALCLTYEPVTYHDAAGRPFRAGRSRVTPGVELTRDGLVGVGVGTGQQWLDFCAMVGHPEWTEDRSNFAERSHLRDAIAAWMAERSTEEILELAAAFRIPHAPIGNGASIPDLPQVRARHAVVPNPRDGFAEPAPPVRFVPPILQRRQPAPALPDTADPMVRTSSPTRTDCPPPTGPAGLPYSGLRILDLTAFWAGPLCTQLLALLGAEVLHVESPRRPDGTRMLGPRGMSGARWWEESGIFAALNAGKRGITLDLTHEEGRSLLRRLLATCDVVVENFTPRVMDQLGFNFQDLRHDHPGLIVVRMPGFGLDGPARDDPAFAFVIEDMAGLTWQTGHPQRPPVSPYCVGDSNAGLHALYGLLIALEHRQRTGEGCLVEAAMIDAALAISAEQIVEWSASGVLTHRNGNRSPHAAPQNLYETGDADLDSDHRWVAISVATNEQWRCLAAALGNPRWTAEERFSTLEGRRDHHEELDAHLNAWCRARRRDEVVSCLARAGVPVAPVLQPHEQSELEVLKVRGFFEVVHHPVIGPVRHRTVPMRFSKGPDRWHRDPAPLLGQHTAQVLAALGVGTEDVARLRDAMIIGDAPIR